MSVTRIMDDLAKGPRRRSPPEQLEELRLAIQEQAQTLLNPAPERMDFVGFKLFFEDPESGLVVVNAACAYCEQPLDDCDCEACACESTSRPKRLEPVLRDPRETEEIPGQLTLFGGAQ